MAQRYSLNVNGTVHTVEADPDMPLLYALKNDVGLNNPQFGCGLAQCGACTVHLNGQPVRSCVTAISDVGDGKVVTLSGLGTPEKPPMNWSAWIQGNVLPAALALEEDAGRRRHVVDLVDQGLSAYWDTLPADGGVDEEIDSGTDGGTDAGNLCGDSTKQASEACDDGNQTSGDGCNANCSAVEPGWLCDTPGRACIKVEGCGNGRVEGEEKCDDRNNISGDGCNAACDTVEPGWNCPQFSPTSGTCKGRFDPL